MNDTIYRQDAIDALIALAIPLHLDSACEDIWERDRTLDNAIDAMRGLPSAHPEIVRCKDCKWCAERYNPADNSPYWICKNLCCGTDADGFCYEGEFRQDG